MPVLKVKENKPRARTRFYAFNLLSCGFGSPLLRIHRPDGKILEFNRNKLSICVVDFKTENYYKKEKK
jgi:hypothetical protein